MIDYKDRRKVYTLILLGLALLFSIPVVIKIRMNAVNNVNRIMQSEMLVDISKDWKDELDNPVDLSRLDRLEDVNHDEKITIYYDLPDILSKEQRINFLSSNIYFRAHINGVNVYGNHIPSIKLLGKSYGVAYNSILIQKVYQGSRIYIDIERIYEDSGSISNMFYGGNAAYLYYFLSKFMFSFILSILIIVVGVLFYIFSRAISQEKVLQKSLRSFALVSVLFGVWALGKTSVPILLQNDPNLWKLFDYPVLIILPFPTILFVNGLLEKPKSIYVKIIFYSTIVDMALCLLMRLVFGYDFHECKYIVHFVLVIMLGLIVWMVIKDGIRKSKTVLLIGFGLVVFGGAFDLLKYYMQWTLSADNALFTRIGYFTLEILLFHKYIVMIIQSMRTYGETEMYKKMAFIDALTGIGNRAAFLQAEKELQNRLDAEDGLMAAVFSIDINYLKQVNDTYGHVNGDVYIKTCADLIKSSFGAYGDVFRTGGDEFVVFISGSEPESTAEFCISEFNEMIKLENEKKKLPIDISIAYGFSICNNSDAIESAEIIADKRMYEMKKEMKMAF